MKSSKKKRKIFRVSKSENSLRLDVFLSSKLEEYSRSWIKNLIKEDSIFVNKKSVNPSYGLSEGDVVSGYFYHPPEISLEPDDTFKDKIKIVFENKDFLVVNKPSGIVVHPSSSTPNKTLVNWLLWRNPEVAGVGDNFNRSGQEDLRPGVVHRLDKETSGLMAIAKNQKTFLWLKKSFKERKVKKAYRALVHGNVKKDSGSVDYPIGRSKSDPTKQAAFKSKSNVPETARQAKTDWRIIKRYADFTYLELFPVTGRMHQIRVHMKAVGHPVAGDEKYASKKKKGPKNLSRMFLHASSLSFSSPSGEKFSFSADLPKELSNTLKNLPFMVQ